MRYAKGIVSVAIATLMVLSMFAMLTPSATGRGAVPSMADPEPMLLDEGYRETPTYSAI